MTNEILLQRARNGDPEAFGELMRPHEALVWRVCWHYMENREDARDASQEVMLKAWRSLGRFRGDAGLETWLYSICRSVCTDALRRRRLRQGDSVEEMVERGLDVPEEGPGVEEQLQQQERRDTLRAALRLLPEDMRTALLLSAAEQRSYEEIARIMDVSVGTVKSRISRGRKKLTEILREWEQSGAPCVQQSERRARE